MSNDFKVGKITAPRTFHQLGILILDGSGSMAAIGDGNISLADSVNRAVREFFGYFKFMFNFVCK